MIAKSDEAPAIALVGGAWFAGNEPPAVRAVRERLEERCCVVLVAFEDEHDHGERADIVFATDESNKAAEAEWVSASGISRFLCLSQSDGDRLADRDLCRPIGVLAQSAGDDDSALVVMSDACHSVETAYGVEELLLHLLPHASTIDDELVKRNIRLLVGEASWFFNRYTRLLSFDATAMWRGGGSFECSLHCRTGRELRNALGTIEPLAHTGRYALQGDVVLPGGFEPEDIALSLVRCGRELVRFEAPKTVTEQRAGLIGLANNDSEGLSIVSWLDAPLACVRIDGAEFEARPAGAEKAGPRVSVLHSAFRQSLRELSISVADGVGQGSGDVSAFASAPQPADRQLKVLRDCYAGQTGWIIGNGPSVRLADLEQLKGVPTFAFNRFYLAYGDTKFRPDFLVSGDEQMIADFGEEMVRQSEAQVMLASAQRPKIGGSFGWVPQYPVFPSLFSLDAARGVTPGGSTPYVAMQLAYFMGIRKLYLYGMDFSFDLRRRNDSPGAERSMAGDGNHFIANYRSGRPWTPPSFRNICSSFLAARLLFESEGGFIRNATRGGLLEIFERTPFDEAVETL